MRGAHLLQSLPPASLAPPRKLPRRPPQPPGSHRRRWGVAALMARAGFSRADGRNPDSGRVRPCPQRLCRFRGRPGGDDHPGAGAVRATRASLRGCAGSAERLGARGAGAALGAGGAPGRDELTAVAPGLSAEPGGGSSAAPGRGPPCWAWTHASWGHSCWNCSGWRCAPEVSPPGWG